MPREFQQMIRPNKDNLLDNIGSWIFQLVKMFWNVATFQRMKTFKAKINRQTCEKAYTGFFKVGCAAFRAHVAQAQYKQKFFKRRFQVCIN